MSLMKLKLTSTRSIYNHQPSKKWSIQKTRLKWHNFKLPAANLRSIQCNWNIYGTPDCAILALAFFGVLYAEDNSNESQLRKIGKQYVARNLLFPFYKTPDDILNWFRYYHLYPEKEFFITAIKEILSSGDLEINKEHLSFVAGAIAGIFAKYPENLQHWTTELMKSADENEDLLVRVLALSLLMCNSKEAASQLVKITEHYSGPAESYIKALIALQDGKSMTKSTMSDSFEFLINRFGIGAIRDMTCAIEGAYGVTGDINLIDKLLVPMARKWKEETLHQKEPVEKNIDEFYMGMEARNSLVMLASQHQDVLNHLKNLVQKSKKDNVIERVIELANT